MFLYLDESGDLGLEFNQKKTSRYLIIAILVCLDIETHRAITRAVKRTLRNKLPKNTTELKGNNLAISIKRYFMKEVSKENNWCLYTAVADKQAWMRHHKSKNNYDLKKKALYDELAKRLFSQINYLVNASRVDIVIDRSKNKSEIRAFDESIMAAIKEHINTNKAPLTIRHRDSKEDFGLQAIDLFCAGIGRKYEKSDFNWYNEFSDRIAVEIEYKF